MLMNLIIEKHARKQRRAVKVPDRWVYVRDWQHKQPIANRDHHRETLLKSHRGALAHQQMADASWRIPHERRSRWSASARTWREDFYASLAAKVTKRGRSNNKERRHYLTTTKRGDRTPRKATQRGGAERSGRLSAVRKSTETPAVCGRGKRFSFLWKYRTWLILVVRVNAD